MSTQRTDILFNRALHLICGEFGYTLDQAMAWLNRDEDWVEEDKAPPTNVARPDPLPGSFIQCTRTRTFRTDHALDAMQYAERGRPPEITD